MNTILKVNEIFKSIQGESTYAGLPCVFIRLTGCNLRCTYCDTVYSYDEGQNWNIPDLIAKIHEYKSKLVEITGGEPLLQPGTSKFIKQLLREGFSVLIETNGSFDIRAIHKKATVIMDIKCPGSGMSKKNLWANVDHLKHSDEVKFVVSDKKDYSWAKSKIKEFNLSQRCKVIFSAVYGKLEPRKLAEWILSDNLQARFQLQTHKYIWGPDRRGV
jgi:7-carboxy-7-deazaguanine synthase